MKRCEDSVCFPIAFRISLACDFLERRGKTGRGGGRKD